jgi:bleomycin hydrolase
MIKYPKAKRKFSFKIIFKRKFFFFQIVFCLMSISVFAGNSKPTDAGILNQKQISEIQQSFKLDAPTRAAMNAFTENKLFDLVKNEEVYRSLDFIFSNELKEMKVTDQERSGRCWLFAAYNIVRSDVAEKNNLKNFEFSESFSMFWDKLEKANLFLEYVIMNRKDINKQDGTNDREFVLLLKNPCSDGGFWHMAKNCIQKYGAVPKSVMKETKNSSSTREMNKLLKQRLRIGASELLQMAANKKSEKQLRKTKLYILKDIYRILAIALGEPPSEFVWRFTDKDEKPGPHKTYTPKSFWDEEVGVDLDNYVVIGNCPTQPYNKNYQIKLGRGQLEGMDWTFLNMEMSVLKELAQKVLLDSVPVQFSVDVAPQKDSKEGYLAMNLLDYESLIGVKLPFDKAQMVLMRESMPNHSMALVGIDIADGKPIKWKVENSWGTDRGKDGFFIMTDEWFGNYGYSVIIDKKYLSPEIIKLHESKPVQLPYWDPLANCIMLND